MAARLERWKREKMSGSPFRQRRHPPTPPPPMSGYSNSAFFFTFVCADLRTPHASHPQFRCPGTAAHAWTCIDRLTVQRPKRQHSKLFLHSRWDSCDKQHTVGKPQALRLRRSRYCILLYHSTALCLQSPLYALTTPTGLCVNT